MPKVVLLEYTPDPEKTVAAAAKLCYSKSGIASISEKMSDEDAAKFLKNLTDMGHFSPVEHACFTFGIEGISRSCSHQLVRHRIASFSQQSQRYVNPDRLEYIIPPQIENCPSAKQIFIEHMKACEKAYRDITAELYKTNCELLKSENPSFSDAKLNSAAEKKSIEDARYVLPNASATKLVMSMNARSLMNFFRLRLCQRAQWEIRELAYEMLYLVKKASPALFKNAGPSCVTGGCSEGAMTCGKPELTRARIREIQERIC